MDTGLGDHLGSILERHGRRWQIGQDRATGVWTAVERPTPTALNIVVARTIGELAVKLDAEGSEAG